MLETIWSNVVNSNTDRKKKYMVAEDIPSHQIIADKLLST